MEHTWCLTIETKRSRLTIETIGTDRCHHPAKRNNVMVQAYMQITSNVMVQAYMQITSHLFAALLLSDSVFAALLLSDSDGDNKQSTNRGGQIVKTHL